ncbi:MAG TPA: hypothetical protein PKD64_00995 [Pirellulaceae bacterium]|nr:hypothetical protein [Pirellulaceae bacterium]HMO90747.1 hypothetical protein [Pirellulaceae bacterium]HMP67998.1 hypothetical protein [Pirellulaceae bacterium]
MSYNRHVSAAAATKTRSGVNHISRLVELWLKNMELADEVTTVKVERSQNISSSTESRRPKTAANTNATNRATHKSQVKNNPRKLTRHSGSSGDGLPVGQVQTTFAFYQNCE